MRNLASQLLQALDGGRSVALCRLVETRGSTPQKPGATMLVFADGSQAGTLGGGCVEAEVKRRALALLSSGTAEVCKFQLDSDYGWDDGLICGGRMQVLIDPIAPTDNRDYFQQLGDLLAHSVPCTEAIVFDNQRSDLPATACYLIDANEKLLATRHVADATDLPTSLSESLRSVCQRPRCYAVSGVAFLPLLGRFRLVIVGGGHVGKAVAELSVDLDFDVIAIDDRPEYVSEERFPRAEQRLSGSMDQILPALAIDSQTYCLIVTRGHNNDQEALFHLINRGAAYVGMIGSKRKTRLIFENLVAEGMSVDVLASVFAPVGIDIGSQTVAEIAISITAELVAHRNREGHIPGRPESISLENLG